MECPICGSDRVQFRSKNNITLVSKYKCLACKQVFEVNDDKPMDLLSHIGRIAENKKEGKKNENSDNRRFTSIV